MVKVKRVAEPHPPPYYDLDVLFLLADKSNFPSDLTADLAFRRGNILGTVTQSGGTPTGALIETDTNSNGTYVRLANGLQFCWNNNIGNLQGTSAVGNIFRSASPLSWTYPATFSATPLVLPKAGNHTNSWGAANVGSTSSCSIHLFAATSVATDIQMGAMAIGFWF